MHPSAKECQEVRFAEILRNGRKTVGDELDGKPEPEAQVECMSYASKRNTLLKGPNSTYPPKYMRCEQFGKY